MRVAFLQNPSAVAQFCRDHGITYLALFGSRAREEGSEKSDVDLLVDFSEPKSLIDFVKLEKLLSNTIGLSVDLVSRKGLSPFIRPYIEDDIVVLYEKK